MVQNSILLEYKRVCGPLVIERNVYCATLHAVEKVECPQHTCSASFLGSASFWGQTPFGGNNFWAKRIVILSRITIIFLRFCVIERCCGNKNTAPNQSFTRVSDIFKIHAIASSPRKERSVSAKELAIYDFTHSTRLPWEIGLERVWKNKCGSGNKYQINVKYGSGIGAQRFLNMWLLQRQIFHGYRIFQHL